MKLTPAKKLFSNIYLNILMFFFGRAFQAAYIADKTVKSEIDCLPDNFSFILKVHQSGPQMIVKKTKKGKLKYSIKKVNISEINLIMILNNIERALNVLTFQNSSTLEYIQGGVSVKGDLRQSLAIIRCIVRVQYFLLPKIIAKNVLNRYNLTTFFERIYKRVLIYILIFFAI